MKWLSLCLAAGLALAGFACGDRGRSDEGEVRVYAGIPPIAFLAERIAGDRARVETLVSGGQNPHTFDPTPRQVVSMERADIYLSIGLPFESAIVQKVKRNNPDMDLVRLVEAMPADHHGEHAHEEHHETDGEHAQEDEHGHHEEHGHEEGHESAPDHEHAEDGHAHHHGHDHDGPDPHIWLSPPRLRAMARAIADALVAADPDHAEQYRSNLDAFLADLQEVDQRIEDRLQPFRGRRFYVYHPAFGHFGEAYGLEQRAVEVGGKAPTLKQMKQLVDQARQDDVRIIFVQPQFEPKAAEAVARELDGAVVKVDPLNRNVLESLQSIADRLEEAFTETREQP